MKHAVILIAFLTGCDLGNDEQTLTATWHLTSITGEAVRCPAGFGSAALVTGLSITPPSELADETFTRCDAGSLAQVYARGDVSRAYIEITSDDHVTPLARSLTNDDTGMYFNSFDDDVSMDTAVLIDGGYFQFSWQLAHADLTEAQCGDDGVAEIAIEAQSVDTMVGSETRFSCGDPHGRAALAPGRYLVTISARDEQHQVVGTPHSLGEQLILDPSKLSPINDLLQITIAIP